MAQHHDDEYHLELLCRYCRICANLLRKSKRKGTVYQCNAKELLVQIGVEIVSKFTYSKYATPNSLPQDLFPCFSGLHTLTQTLKYVNFSERSDRRRQPQVVKGRLPTVIESLQSSVHPSWEHGLLSPPTTQFSPDRPAKQKCTNIVESPLIRACSPLLFSTCAVEMLRQKASYPACGCGHSSLPVSAGVGVCSVLLLHSCRCLVELQKMKQHLSLKCAWMFSNPPHKNHGTSL
jgi:hypothetical protein